MAEEDADEDVHYAIIIQYEGDNECSNNEVIEGVNDDNGEDDGFDANQSDSDSCDFSL